MQAEKNILKYILESWATEENPFYSTDQILTWIKHKNEEVNVRIHKIPYAYDGDWHYDPAELGIVNRQRTFFAVRGIHFEGEDGVKEQPIIVQDGIGYLGIIARIIDGTMYFLMQAKIEPGNINNCQISPTIQATRSNFMRAHGGREPAFYSYFANKEKYRIIADQIQSEQSSRFLGKRNRNIVILVDEDIEVPSTHRWMTLGQIKQLMRYDNIVNMDTRSVISCIPFAMRDVNPQELDEIRKLFREEAFFNSMFGRSSGEAITHLYQYMNDYKMLKKYERRLVDLNSLQGWTFENGEYVSPESSFRIVFCDIEIEDREVRCWQQPLLEAVGRSEFGLLVRISEDNVMEFLVQAKSEVGCFDRIEIAPSVQKEPADEQVSNPVDRLFFERLQEGKGIRFRGLFSEEGGRFYHEENWNTILEIGRDELGELPEGYFWVDFRTLNTLIQFNNCLNIQLRNLISLLEL